MNTKLNHPVNVAYQKYKTEPTPENRNTFLSACSDFLYSSTLIDGKTDISGYLRSWRNGEEISNDVVMKVWRKLDEYVAPSQADLPTLIEEGHSVESALYIIDQGGKLSPITDPNIIPLLKHIAKGIRIERARLKASKELALGEFGPEEFQQMDYSNRHPSPSSRGRDGFDVAAYFEDSLIDSTTDDSANNLDMLHPSIFINYTRKPNPDIKVSHNGQMKPFYKNRNQRCERCSPDTPLHYESEHFDDWMASLYSIPASSKSASQGRVNYKMEEGEYFDLLKLQADNCARCGQALPPTDLEIGLTRSRGLVHVDCQPDLIMQWRQTVTKHKTTSAWYPASHVLGERTKAAFVERLTSATYRQQSTAINVKPKYRGEQSARQQRINQLEYIVNAYRGTSRFLGKQSAEQIATLEGRKFNYSTGPNSKHFKEVIGESGDKWFDRSNVAIRYCAAAEVEGIDAEHFERCIHSHERGAIIEQSLITAPRPHELDADGKIQSVAWEGTKFETKLELGFWERWDSDAPRDYEPLPKYVFTTRRKDSLKLDTAEQKAARIQADDSYCHTFDDEFGIRTVLLRPDTSSKWYRRSDSEWIRATLNPPAFGPQLEHRRSVTPIHPFIFSGKELSKPSRPFSSDGAIHTGTFKPFSRDMEVVIGWTPLQWLAFWRSRPQLWGQSEAASQRLYQWHVEDVFGPHLAAEVWIHQGWPKKAVTMSTADAFWDHPNKETSAKYLRQLKRDLASGTLTQPAYEWEVNNVRLQTRKAERKHEK